jgi:putative acetyltransferase
MTTPLMIQEDDLSGIEIQELLAMHQADAVANSPPGTSYALDLSGLQTPDITVWSAWRGGALAGCGAIKAFGNNSGEIKSMRTAPAFLRHGIADQIVAFLINIARERGYTYLCLETSTNDAYAPAVALYRKHGFVSGPVYGDYPESPHNQYFYLDLG